MAIEPPYPTCSDSPPPPREGSDHPPSSFEGSEGTRSSSSASWSSNKRKRLELFLRQDGLEIDGNGDTSGVVIAGDSWTDDQDKQCIEYGGKSQKQVKKTFLGDLLCSSTPTGPEFKMDAEDYYDSDDYEDEGNGSNKNHSGTSATDSDSDFDLANALEDLDLPSGVEASIPWMFRLTPKKAGRNDLVIYDEMYNQYKVFRQFDVIQDYSDHHYKKELSISEKPPRHWAERIQHEWKVLGKDLPETILVRVYEGRMDLLRAVMVGAPGTPYHDGLFFFDVFFPPTYPDTSPLVYYHSGGLQLNPNLYKTGEVCLALLNTCYGGGHEQWNPNSNILQVLVSIQALVLNEKPYFDEPNFQKLAGTIHGESKSLSYNEDTFLLSCKKMLQTLREPPKNFEDFVSGHFHERGRSILAACRAFINGARVGSVVGESVFELHVDCNKLPSAFRSSLENLYGELLKEFSAKGVDCDKFLGQKDRAAILPDTMKTQIDWGHIVAK